MRVHFVLCLFVVQSFVAIKSDNYCEVEIENTLRALLSPREYPTLQLQALRRQLIHKLQQALERVEEEEDPYLKRSLSALARWNNLPDKRNLEALARAGYIRTLPEVPENNDSIKRNAAGVDSNEDALEEIKRGIQSLARNGEMPYIGEPLSKRNLQSLAKNYNFPVSDKRVLGSGGRSDELNYQYKRNIAALAREGALVGKRNVAALLRQDSYLNEIHNHHMGTESPDAEKRNIASIKAQYSPKFKRSANRKKRQIDYQDTDNLEYPSPVYQNNNVYDYEELMKELTGSYPDTQKRFLGSVARTGWFRPGGSRISRYTVPEKRHIGSLARLGWLPTLRNVRRFNRSGRSTGNDDSCRETSSDGENTIDEIPENPPFGLDDKRFLLQPAVDNILLKKLYMHPKSH